MISVEATVIRLKGKNKENQEKSDFSEWLGSRDSNHDSMIQSHVSQKLLFNNNSGKAKVFQSLLKIVLTHLSQFLTLVLSVETRHIGGANFLPS